MNNNVVSPGQNAGFIECNVCHAQVPSSIKFCNELYARVEKLRIAFTK